MKIVDMWFNAVIQNLTAYGKEMERLSTLINTLKTSDKDIDGEDEFYSKMMFNLKQSEALHDNHVQFETVNRESRFKQKRYISKRKINQMQKN